MIFLFTGLGLNYKKGQGARRKSSKTQSTVTYGRRVDLVKPEGFFRKNTQADGVSADLSRWIRFGWRRLDLSYIEPVRDDSRSISDQRPRFNEAEITPQPSD